MKKRRIDIAVISNVHLGSPTCQADALLAYLSSISPKILILSGKFIDFGPYDKALFPPGHYRVLKKIFGMASSGTAIYYVHGNRDSLVRRMGDRSLGSIHLAKDLFLDLDGKKAWFTQGDFLRSPLLEKKWTHGLGAGFFGVLCKLSGWNHMLRNPRAKGRDGANARVFSLSESPLPVTGSVREAAAKLAAGRGFEYVICGAPHQTHKQWFEGRYGKCQFLSAGDWVENLTALEYNFKRWKPYRYSEDKLSPFFADEDLKQMDMDELLSKNAKTGSSLA